MAANVTKIRDALGLMKDIIPKLPEEKLDKLLLCLMAIMQEIEREYKLDERGLYTIKK